MIIITMSDSRVVALIVTSFMWKNRRAGTDTKNVKPAKPWMAEMTMTAILAECPAPESLDTFKAREMAGSELRNTKRHRTTVSRRKLTKNL